MLDLHAVTRVDMPLSNGLNTSETHLRVATDKQFLAAPFVIGFDDGSTEICLVTAGGKGTLDWTLQRGYGGTTLVAHANDTDVVCVMGHHVYKAAATVGGGSSLTGVTTDGLGGLLAQNFTAYPEISAPTEPPTVEIIPWEEDGDAPLPAGTYDYQYAWGNENLDITEFFGIESITLDGTQLPRFTSPSSRPANAVYMAFARLVGGTTYYRVPTHADATVPFVDFRTDDLLISSAAAWPFPTYNQTFPTATLGPASIMGSVAAQTAIAEWNATPAFSQPSLVVSRADTQAQIDELVAFLVARGSLADNRVA